MDVLVKKRFYWPLISKDVRQFCGECVLALQGKYLGINWIFTNIATYNTFVQRGYHEFGYITAKTFEWS